ncbi:MAG: dicarboxylate/amino acid:cation symporter [Verrucomicrobiota bacterium]|nr:dicarboxylate/amino acid:cation symporter [Verrucomicrobiota bacterium]
MTSSDKLATRILISLGVGIVAGLLIRGLGQFWPGILPPARWVATEVLDPLGQIFLRLLFMVVVPLVFGSLALGVTQLGRLDRLGPLAGRTFLFFLINMAIGTALGLLIMNLVRPGEWIDEATQKAMLTEFGGSAATIVEKKESTAIDLNVIVDMFLPRNFLQAVVNFQVLPLIIFALLVGAAGTTLSAERRARLIEGLELLNELMTRLVHLALLLAPFAVPAMIASVIIKFGFGFLQSLSIFLAAALLTIALHLFGTMSLLLKMFTRRSPRLFFRAIRTVIVTAFSTSSSNATLPTTIQVSRERLGISASTAGFVLPLGATMNMSGTALYEGCVVLFIAQVYGVPVSLFHQLFLLTMAVLSAVAVAGIPGASLPLIVGLLATLGIPPEGIALVLGVDRILDMARTTLNVAADVVTACIVDEQVGQVSPAE